MGVAACVRVTSRPDGGYGVIDIPLRFGEVPATVRITVDGELRIAGLFILERGVPFPPGVEPFVGWLLIGGGALVITAGVLGHVGRLPRNGLIGIRLPSTMRSDLSWLRAHQAALVPTVAAGFSLSAGGAWHLWVDASDLAVLAFTGVSVGALVLAGIVAHRAATR